jgi:predicted amidophosphoribosyltransferase
MFKDARERGGYGLMCYLCGKNKVFRRGLCKSCYRKERREGKLEELERQFYSKPEDFERHYFLEGLERRFSWGC